MKPLAEGSAEIRIGMPLYRFVLPQTFLSVWQLSQSNVFLDVEFSADVSTSRNAIASRLEEPFLLFVDGDMAFTSRQIEELYCALREKPERGAVAAHACRWDGTQVPVCNWKNGNRKGHDWLKIPEAKERCLEYVERGTIEEVDMFGTGVALISKEVFDKLPKPWFDFNRKLGYGEDVNFCQRMIAAKFKPCVHFGVCVGHIGPTLWMPEGAKKDLVKREYEEVAHAV